MDGNFPKIKYHLRGGGSILVTSAVQEKALGGEWIDNKLPEPEVVPIPEQPKKRGRQAKVEPTIQ